MDIVSKSCFQCKGLVSVVKSVIFYCDCLVTLCPECARHQLARKDWKPYTQLVTCPCCSETSRSRKSTNMSLDDFQEKINLRFVDNRSFT
jgi:hypothetical protein